MNAKDIVILDGMRKNRYGDGIEGHEVPVIHKALEPFTVARIALDMAGRWGSVAAMPDGEDSAGRSRLRLQSPAEVAQRACETAAELWSQFEQRGWLLEIPLPTKMTKEEKEKAESL